MSPVSRREASPHWTGLPASLAGPPLVKEELRTRWYQPKAAQAISEEPVHELPDHHEGVATAVPVFNEPFSQPASSDEVQRRNIERYGSDLTRRLIEPEYLEPGPPYVSMKPKDGTGRSQTPVGPMQQVFDAAMNEDEHEDNAPVELLGDLPTTTVGKSRNRNNGGKTQETSKSPSSGEITKPRGRTKPVAAPKASSPQKKVQPLLIAVFGLTGAGKSSLISKLSGEIVEIGHGLHSKTNKIQEVHCRINNLPVILVDTPGFDDTNRLDAEVLHDIATYLHVVHKDKVKLTGILYLHKISDNRMTGVALKNLRLLRNLCGTKNLQNVTLLSTMWDLTPLADAQRREKELLEDRNFWGRLKADGASVDRYDNTLEEAVRVVGALLQRKPVELQIQSELAKGKTLLDTKAGREVEKDLSEEQKKAYEERSQVNQDLIETSETRPGPFPRTSRGSADV